MIEISAIALTPDNCGTIRPLLQCLRAQTVRERIEVVIVAPGGFSALDMDEEEIRGFAAVKIVDSRDMNSTAEARAAGIRAASAPIVVLTEDHSLPDPAWAEALLRAHLEPWAAVGPAVTNGNDGSLVSWANFLIEYSEWMAPSAGGVVSHLPGHNSSYKRNLLLAYGDELGKWLESESILHWDLAARGHKLYLEARARTNHLNFSRAIPSITLRFYAGRLFAGSRARHWPLLHRLAYFAGSPLIPCVRFRRILREFQRPGRSRNLIPRVLPLLMLLLIVDGLGEMCGYACGPGDAVRRITQMDFHRERFMNARDRRSQANPVQARAEEYGV